MFIAKSIVAAGTGLLMHVGAGCFSPTILEDDGETVTLRYGPWATVVEISSKAEHMCAEHGRDAHLVADTESLAEPNFREATFACVEPAPAAA